MIPTSLSGMIDGLEKKTDLGEVNWRRTPSSTTFAVFFKRSVVTIAHEENEFQGTQWVRVEILNADGEKVDGFSVDSTEPEIHRMTDLYDAARRKALGVAEAVENVMEELEQQGQVGADPIPTQQVEDHLPF